MSFIPGVGPPLAGTMFIGAGQQEAAENARKAGATPMQIKEAAQSGTVAGATDLVDVALARLLPFGTGTATKRILTGLVEGGIVEAGQEGIQQFMQNMIARGVYDPTKDLWDQVGYSMLVAAISGGIGGGALSIPGGSAQAKAATQTAPGSAPSVTPPGPAATSVPVGAPPTPTVESIDVLPPFMGGPPLTEGEKDAMRLEREVRREEIQTLPLDSPEFRHAVARLKDISLQLTDAEKQESEPGVAENGLPTPTQVVVPTEAEGQAALDNVVQFLAKDTSSATSPRQGEQVLDEFLTSNRRNAWVDLPEGKMYLRRGMQPGGIRTIDMANVDFEQKGTGAFTKYLGHLEQRMGEAPNLDAVVVESIFNPMLIPFLKRRGYSRIEGQSGPPSFILLKGDRRSPAELAAGATPASVTSPVATPLAQTPSDPTLVSPPTVANRAPNSLSDLTDRHLATTAAMTQAARSGDMVTFKKLRGELETIQQERQARLGPELDPQEEAWHGGPRPHTGFKSEYLLSGEGSMVFGWGHYFGESRGTGEYYQRLTEIRKLVETYIRRSGGDRVLAIRKLEELLPAATGQAKTDFMGALAILRGEKPENTLFQVNINTEKEFLLDHDKAWGQQSPFVRAQLEKLRADPAYKSKDQTGASWRGRSGQSIYEEISRTLGSDKAASLMMLEYGIQGLTFLDQFSRGGRTRNDIQQTLDRAYGEAATVMKGGKPPTGGLSVLMDPRNPGQALGRFINSLEKQLETAPEKLTKNYIIFNPDLVDILSLNGEPVPGAQLKSAEDSLKGLFRQWFGAPPSPNQQAKQAVHYGNLHPMSFDAKTNQLVVHPPQPLVGMGPEHPANLRQYLVPPQVVNLLDDTIVEFAPDFQMMFTELGQQRFGERFNQYVYGVGLILKTLRDNVASIVDGYEGLLNEGVGVAIGFGQRNQGFPIDRGSAGFAGVSVRFPFSATFINAFAAQDDGSPQAAAASMFMTMVHELAHHRERDHGLGFIRELQGITGVLLAHPESAQQAILAELTQHMTQNWDIYQSMNGVANVHDIRSLAKRQSGNSADASSDALNALSNAAPSGRRGGRSTNTSGLRAGPADTGGVPDDRGLSVSYAGYANPRDTGQSTNQRALAANGASSAVTAVPIQQTTAGIRSGLQRLFAGTKPGLGAGQQGRQGGTQGGGNVGGLPPGVAGAAAHADHINWGWKWWLGLDQMRDMNPRFMPVVRYAETAQQMHLEESKIHDGALKVAKPWQSLSEKQNSALTNVLEDMVRMEYLTLAEKTQGVVRRPTPAEDQALFAKHGLGAKGQKVYQEVRDSLDTAATMAAQNAVAEARRNITDPAKLQARLQTITNQIATIKQRPFFPMTRFGTHFVTVKDASGASLLFETFERRGLLPARYFQKRRADELQSQLQPGETITVDKFPEENDPLTAMPSLLLQAMQGQMTLTPTGLQAVQQLQMTSARHFASRFSNRRMTPGYSMDFLRGYSKFMFHFGRYYAQTKYGWQLRGHIQMARGVQTNKATAMADYMQDHLKNTVLNPRGDFGKLKGFAFLWTIGYVPAAATINASQTPAVTLPFLAAHFGDAKATYEIGKAMGNIKNYYKRGVYKNQTAFVSRALSYGIETGRITETQAPELAGMAQSGNLLNSVLGSRAQKLGRGFMEKSSFLFEMMEQMNRRVAYRATLELAMKNPQAKFIADVVRLHPKEYTELLSQFSPAEARAIIAANVAVERTQGIYAKWARPRFMRHPIANVVLIYKKFLQFVLQLMLSEGHGYWIRFILISMFMYGFMGLPGADDLKEIIKGLGRFFFGKHFDIEQEARQHILDVSSGKIDPDLVLHGMARKGWGLPALVDAMGEKPGRSLLSTGPQAGQNVPLPVFDRSRSGGMGNVLPVELGKMIDPASDPNSVIGEQTQKASGAMFSIGFNFYKFINDAHHPWGDPKRWEKVLPRFLGNGTRAYEAYDEGRSRGGRGGPASGTTVVPYDIHDTEQAAEMIGIAMGYRNLREAKKWDQVMAQTEVTKHYHIERQLLMEQFAEAVAVGNPKGRSDVLESIRKYNRELPQWAKGQAITPEGIETSVAGRQRAKVARETGVPEHETDVGIAKHIQQMFPGTIIDVRKAR